MKVLHDLHIHTNLSFCGDSSALPTAYLPHLSECGIVTVGFCDHVWDTGIAPAPNAFYKGQDMEHIRSVVLPDAPNMRILRGCEADMDKNGVIGLSEASAKSLDYVLVSPSHSQHDAMIPDDVRHDVKKLANVLCERFSAVVENPMAKYITAISHPFFPAGNRENFDEVLFRISDETLEDLFADANYQHVAIEINAAAFSSYAKNAMHRSELFRIYETARECGCKFVFGTDCHHPDTYADLYKRLCILAEMLEIGEADICPLVQKNA